MSNLIVSVIVVLLPLILWLVPARLAVSKSVLKHIPELRFEDDNSEARYATDSRSLLRRGYDQYLRKGIPFQVRNPVPELGPHVFLPLKYLDEVKNAPRSLASFEVFSEKFFLLDYSDGPRQTDAIAHVVRVDLTKNLDNLVAGIYEEAITAVGSRVTSKAWTTLPAYQTISSIATQVSAYGLVGPSLCRDPAWIQVSLQCAMTVFGSAVSIRDNYSARWRWLSRYGEAPKQLRLMRAQAAKLLKPLCEERLGALEAKEKVSSGFLDCTNWLLRFKKPESLEKIADQQLFLALASTHTTSGVLTSILFDLLEHHECHGEVLAEIREVLAECNGHWTLQQIAKMKKLDSFMTESNRINPLGYMSVQRIAVKSHTFKDGFHLPVGTLYQFPADGVHHDPTFYPDPAKFDMHRFLRLREEVDPNKFHFASVSESRLSFGAGAHACPGRFLATVVMKMILVVLLTRYEVKLEDAQGEDGGELPLRVPSHFTLNPNPTAKIVVRKL